MRLHRPRQHRIASNARQSPRAGAGSIHLVAGHGSGLWRPALGQPVRGLAPMWTPARCRYLRSGRFRVRPGGVRRPWCAAPGGAGRLRIGGLDPCRHRPLIPCGGRSMHARSAVRHAIGSQLAFGRSGFRESRAFHVEPGQPRCSGLEDAASACEHEAHNAERPQSPALHQAYGARNRPGGCPCGVEGAR